MKLIVGTVINKCLTLHTKLLILLKATIYTIGCSHYTTLLSANAFYVKA